MFTHWGYIRLFDTNISDVCIQTNVLGFLFSCPHNRSMNYCIGWLSFFFCLCRTCSLMIPLWMSTVWQDPVVYSAVIIVDVANLLIWRCRIFKTRDGHESDRTIWFVLVSLTFSTLQLSTLQPLPTPSSFVSTNLLHFFLQTCSVIQVSRGMGT